MCFLVNGDLVGIRFRVQRLVSTSRVYLDPLNPKP